MNMMADVRYALRNLRRAPGFAVAAILSLTLGIATSTIVFSLVEGAIWRQPPFTEADRLVVLNITQRTPEEGEIRMRWSWARFRLLPGRLPSLEDVASSSNAVLTMTGTGDPQPLPTEIVSAHYLAVMRAPLVAGSGFTDREDDPGAAQPMVVLGYDTWRRSFDSRPDIVGRTVDLNGVAFTIVGIAAKGFSGISGLAQAWIPATMAPRVTYLDYLTTNQNFITVVGRLRPSATLEAARAEAEVVGGVVHQLQPSERDTPHDLFAATLAPINEVRVDVVTRRALMLLAGAAAVLLLIACANVAGLLLARAVDRRREMAVRLAIGASRTRIIYQLLTESAVLAACAGALGLTIAIWVIAVVRMPATLARGRNFYGAVGEFSVPQLDWWVLAFAVAIAMASVLIAGLLPALQTTRADLVQDLKAGARRRLAGVGAGPRELVVAVQVALTVVLVIGCGLLLASYSRLRGTSLGFEPERLLTFMIRPSEVRYPTAAAPALIDRVLEAVERVPGVASATVDGCAPLSTQCAVGLLQIVGRPWPNAGDAPAVGRHYVAPHHFATLGIPILRGRGITPDDRPGRPAVVVINQAAAAAFWPNEDPIGKRIWFGDQALDNSAPSIEIVGVVGNVAYRPLDERPIVPDFFTPYAQFTYASRMVLVRATSDQPLALVPQIARAVSLADPSLALFDVQTMVQRAQLSWAKQRTQTGLFGAIAAIALCLAVTGIYGVTSFFVAARMREIGVRMALGAPPASIVGISLGRSARLAAVGLAAGLAGGVILSRVMRAALYETSPLDPSVYAGTAAVLGAALLAASYFPVRRALRINPVDVLRNE